MFTEHLFKLESSLDSIRKPFLPSENHWHRLYANSWVIFKFIPSFLSIPFISSSLLLYDPATSSSLEPNNLELFWTFLNVLVENFSNFSNFSNTLDKSLQETGSIGPKFEVYNRQEASRTVNVYLKCLSEIPSETSHEMSSSKRSPESSSLIESYKSIAFSRNHKNRNFWKTQNSGLPNRSLVWEFGYKKASSYLGLLDLKCSLTAKSASEIAEKGETPTGTLFQWNSLSASDSGSGLTATFQARTCRTGACQRRGTCRTRTCRTY